MYILSIYNFLYTKEISINFNNKNKDAGNILFVLESEEAGTASH